MSEVTECLANCLNRFPFVAFDVGLERRVVSREPFGTSVINNGNTHCLIIT